MGNSQPTTTDSYMQTERNETEAKLILEKDKRKCALGYWQLSNRVLLVKLK